MKFSLSPQSSSMFNCTFDPSSSSFSFQDDLSTRRRRRRRHNFLGLLPSWIARWFGHRSSSTVPPQRTDYEIWLWTFIGTFCGVALLQAVFGHAHYFIAKGAPPIVPSYAASAALIYGAIEGSLSQPRPFVGGYLIGAFTGVAITKLFLLLPSEQFQDLLWLSGSLASACAVLLMQITRLMHPPAGAAALIALVNAETRQMGWYYVPVVLLSSLLALAVALIVNNIRRRYPLFWFFHDEPDPLTVPSAVYSVQSTSPNTRVNSIEVLAEKIEKPAPIHFISCAV